MMLKYWSSISSLRARTLRYYLCCSSSNSCKNRNFSSSSSNSIYSSSSSRFCYYSERRSPLLFDPQAQAHRIHNQLVIVRNQSSSSTSASAPTPPNSSDSNTNKDFDFEENLKEEQKSHEREKKIRRLKKIFSTGLFACTLGIAYYARYRQKNILAENLKGCTRLPNSSNFQSSNDFYKCTSPLDCSSSNTSDSDNDDNGSSFSSSSSQKPYCILPGAILRDGTIKAVRNFPIKSDDVIVASFPKSGTTWVQEIVYLIQNDLDFQKASNVIMESRFPFMEYPYPGIKSITKEPGARLLKTHLPYNYLPRDISKAKLIYIVRNPKDVVVSFYHFSRMLTLINYTGRFEDFLEQFERNELPYTPYFGHVESYLAHDTDPNLLILSYEDLSKDPAEVIMKIANFLGKPLNTEEVHLLVEHTRFENMKKNSSVNYEHWNQIGLRNANEAKFLRQGKVGDWKNYFNDARNLEFDDWLAKNNGTNLKFVFDLSK